MTRKNQIILIVTGVLAGLMTVIHFKSVPADSFHPENSEERKYILETLLSEQAVLKSRIVSLRKGIDEKEEKLKKFAKKEQIDFLETMKDDLGLKPISGPGLEIIFDDSQVVNRETLDVNNEALVHAADLRDIVNVLRISQAKAISINDQRIQASTPVSCVGSSILVNNSHTAPPFRIKVIADIEVTKNNLLNEQYLASLHERIKDYSLVFEVYSKEQITVPVYSGDLRGTYIK